MSKDPAVLFYTSDFLSGTYTMSNDQVGMYIRLLCYQHQKGKLTEKDMLAICPNRDEEVWGKFEVEDGFYINKKMYNESERRKKFTDSRKKNLKSKPHMAPHMGAHMETETETITKTLTKLEGGVGGDWESIKKSFLNAEQWMYKFCTSKGVSRDELFTRMQEFINDLELRNEYKELKELQRHFTNWYNKTLKTKKNGNYFDRFSKATRGAHELLEELRAESQANFRSHETDPMQGFNSDSQAE